MKLHYFFGCILAAASLTVWPEIGLAHGGGGGGGGGGRGSHFSGGGARFAGTQFTARSGNRFHRHFHNGNGGVVIFDPLDYGSYYDLPTDGTVYEGKVAPQDAESVPYATPTSDPDIVISPYEPHAIISVAGIPQGAKVQDPVSNLVFLNPSGW
jgi:hypothetical protein